MTWNDWFRFGVSLAVIIVAMLAARWTADFLFRKESPDRLAVNIEGFEGPLVNRAQLQRSWPVGLNDLSERARFRAYMRNVSTFTPPEPATASSPRAPVAEPDFATLLANADIGSGERRARICTACHTFENGGRDGVGPNLWSIVGRDIAARASYDYSGALNEEPGIWAFEKLDAYIENPSNAIPGNKMAFSGIRRARDRAEIIAYLRMQGSADIPLPAPAAASGGESPQGAGDL